MLATRELIQETTQRQRLAGLLPRWLDQIPLYRGRAGDRSHAGGALPDVAFEKLPHLTKHEMRKDFPRNFLRDGADLDTLLQEERVELEHTSGTSEERTPLLLEQGWWARQEEWALRLNPRVARILDDAPGARRLTLNSPNCTSEVCYTGVPSREERTVGNTLYASLSRQPFLWSDEDLARIAREAAEWQPHFLDVDPVYGAVFARYCERHGLRLPSVQCVVTTYEFVSTVHRRLMERVFQVPVYDLYGSTETGHLLMEDEGGGMIPSLETAFLEVVETDRHGVGQLVVTTLTNDYMPLVRYRIGDLVQRHEEPYRTRYVVHGRAMDATFERNGAWVTPRQVDDCFGGVDGLVHYQLRETNAGEWLLQYIPTGSGPEAAALGTLQDRLARLLDGDRVQLVSGDAMLSESSGKFRLVKPRARVEAVG